jgi:hypothetical protein
VLNVVGEPNIGNIVFVGNIQQTGASAFIQTTLSFTISGNAVLYADIYIAQGGSLNVVGNLTMKSTPSSGENCSISGPGGIQLVGNLICPGSLDIGFVEFNGGNLTATTTTTSFLYVNSPSTIAGDVIVHNGTTLSFDGYEVTLVIQGSYYQDSGSLHISTNAMAWNDSFLLANSSLEINDTSIYMDGFEQAADATSNLTVLLARSNTHPIKSQNLSIYDLFYSDTDAMTLTVEVDNQDLYVVYTKHTDNGNFFEDNWIIFALVAGAAAIIVFGLIVLRTKRTSGYQSLS